MLGFTFAFPGLAMQMHLIDTYEASPTEITAWFGLVSLPWFFKPIYGILSDSCPIGCRGRKFHRRPYISIGLVLTSVLWVFLYANFENMDVGNTMITVSVQSLFLCVSDVAADGLMVAAVKKEGVKSRGRLQTLVWSTRAIGGILATYAGFHVQDFFGTKAVYLSSAFLPLVTAFIIWQCPEKSANTIDRQNRGFYRNLQHTCKGVWNTIESAKYLVLFCFVFSATPSYDTTLFVFLQQKLRYTIVQLAELGIISSIFGLLGTVCFYASIHKINPKWAIFWGVVVQSLVRLSLLVVVVDPTWSIGNPTSLALLYLENSAQEFLSKFTQMPLLILAAHACKEPFEAACYATVLSVSNFGGVTSSLFGASLTHGLHISATPENWDGLPSLIEICIGTMFLPVILLFLLPIDFEIPSRNETTKHSPESELSYSRVVHPDELEIEL